MSLQKYKEFWEVVNKDIEGTEAEIRRAQELIDNTRLRLSALEQDNRRLYHLRHLLEEQFSSVESEVEVSERRGLELPGPRSSISSPVGDPQTVRRSDIIRYVLERAGSPMTVKQIIAVLEALAHPLPDNPEVRFNSVYTTMKRRPDLFVQVDQSRWGLVGRDAVPLDLR